MKKIEQSCGTCKYARLHLSGALICHGNPPVPLVTGDKINGHMPPVSPDFWGCRVYTYTAERKVLPKATPKIG